MDSAGIRWTPPESAGLRQNPPDSARIHRNPPESAGICWTPPESTGIRRTPLESAGLCWNPLDSAGQVHWTLSGRILQIPVESGDFRRIPADSLRTGHVNLAHVTLTKSGIWVRWNPLESAGIRQIMWGSVQSSQFSCIIVSYHYRKSYA